VRKTRKWNITEAKSLKKRTKKLKGSKADTASTFLDLLELYWISPIGSSHKC
jgi:hypothetical protein